MKRRLAGALLALPLLLALALAGCGDSGDDDDGIATAGDGDATEQPDSGDGSEELSEEEVYAAQLEYVECMREHGIDMEDPQQGEPLRIQIQGDPEEARAAQEACQDLLPPPPDGAGQEDGQEQMLAFAECMRDNGVESFPDPQSGGGIQIGPEQAEDPDFEAAQETCQDEMGLGEPDTSSNGGGGA